MTFILDLLAALAAGMPATEPADIAWVTTGEFCEPETVLPLPDGTLLVSNVCGYQTEGDGFLTLMNSNGDIVDWRVVDELDSPLGMAMLADTIYVVDNNTIRAFSWPSYEPGEIIELTTIMANDVAVSKDGTVYVTDTVADQVRAISPDRKTVRLIGNGLFVEANGIELHGSTLYVGAKNLWKVDLESLEITIYPDWLGDIDGIEFEADGTLQVTPVGGPLIRIPANGDIRVFGGEGVSSANHGYDPRSGLALIPTGFDNTIIAIRVPSGTQLPSR